MGHFPSAFFFFPPLFQLCLRDEKETPVILREDPKLCKGTVCGGRWLLGAGKL